MTALSSTHAHHRYARSSSVFIRSPAPLPSKTSRTEKRLNINNLRCSIRSWDHTQRLRRAENNNTPVITLIDTFPPLALLLIPFVSVMSGGRSSPGSTHVFRGGFKLPKHLKSPLHASDGEDHSPFGIGHASGLLYKATSMTGLNPESPDGKIRYPLTPSVESWYLSRG